MVWRMVDGATRMEFRQLMEFSSLVLKIKIDIWVCSPP
jgi:hypothetical protein